MAKSFWVKIGDEISGPATAEQLKESAAQGTLQPQHLVSADQQRWVRAGTVKGLSFSPDDMESPASVRPGASGGSRISAPARGATDEVASESPPAPARDPDARHKLGLLLRRARSAPIVARLEEGRRRLAVRLRPAAARLWRFVCRAHHFARSNAGLLVAHVREALGGAVPRGQIRIPFHTDVPNAVWNESECQVRLPPQCVACGKPVGGEWHDEMHVVPDLNQFLRCLAGGASAALLAALAFKSWLVLFGTLWLAFVAAYALRREERLRLRLKRCDEHIDHTAVPAVRCGSDVLYIQPGHKSVKRRFLEESRPAAASAAVPSEAFEFTGRPRPLPEFRIPLVGDDGHELPTVMTTDGGPNPVPVLRTATENESEPAAPSYGLERGAAGPVGPGIPAPLGAGGGQPTSPEVTGPQKAGGEENSALPGQVFDHREAASEAARNVAEADEEGETFRLAAPPPGLVRHEQPATTDKQSALEATSSLAPKADALPDESAGDNPAAQRGARNTALPMNRVLASVGFVTLWLGGLGAAIGIGPTAWPEAQSELTDSVERVVAITPPVVGMLLPDATPGLADRIKPLRPHLVVGIVLAALAAAAAIPPALLLLLRLGRLALQVVGAVVLSPLFLMAAVFALFAAVFSPSQNPAVNVLKKVAAFTLCLPIGGGIAVAVAKGFGGVEGTTLNALVVGCCYVAYTTLKGLLGVVDGDTKSESRA